jgi:hypothetical protein
MATLGAALEEVVRTIASGPIVVRVSAEPDLDLHALAGRACHEGRHLILVVDADPTPAQEMVIAEVARLAWSWFECLSYEVTNVLAQPVPD